jgi:glycosyltransferase involved in cell wall biosynthesis
MMRSDLRVALLATVVEFGGIERVLLTLLRHKAVDVKFTPILYTRAGNERNYFLESLDASGITYDPIHVDASWFKYFNPVRNVGETVARLKTGRFDLVHSHGYRADLIGFVAARYLGLPIISTCHGFISTDSHLRAYNRLDVILLRHFDRVIAVSEQIKTDLIARRMDAMKIHVITNAVREESGLDAARIRAKTRMRLGIAEEEFVLGFVGRLSGEKGLHHLLEAARRWSLSDCRWRLVLVGEGPQRGALEQAVGNFALRDRVIFTGFQTDTSEWYPVMDAFVLPSLTEGTPMVLLEAMANGIPVIATSVGGVSAMIANGSNGILVPPADVPKLLEAMQIIASDGDLRERLRINATKFIRRSHCIDRWIEQMTEAYATTLQQYRK